MALELLYYFEFRSNGCLKHYKFFSTFSNLHFFTNFSFNLMNASKKGLEFAIKKMLF